MGISVIDAQRTIILEEITDINKSTRGEWKHMIVDEQSEKIIDNLDLQDDILRQNVAAIERIDERREPSPDMDALYFLSPDAHIVDCLLADFEVGRYRRAYLLWTSLLEPNLRRRIDEFPPTRHFRASSKTLFSNFYPRESNLVIFRDPWSFPMLYHPACNNLVPKHMQALAQQIAGVCITLGEYPKVRYYQPRNPTHEASVLCSHLARFVQEELDGYAQYNRDFPPQSKRPQGILLITDRSMDLMAPLMTEPTYQAIAHDLLPIKEGDKVTYRMTINANTTTEEEKDYELHERDKTWVDTRHRHLDLASEQIATGFNDWTVRNPLAAGKKDDETLSGPAKMNQVRDGMVNISKTAQEKDSYTLHLELVNLCLRLWNNHNLYDVNQVEESLATGFDSDMRKLKNVLEYVVEVLDDEAVRPEERLRVIIMYILYRGGVIMEDVKKLLTHAGLPVHETEMINNLELLGASVNHKLKEQRRPYSHLFPPRDASPQAEQDGKEERRRRFEPAIKGLLENLVKGTLDRGIFPYVKPPLDPNEDLLAAQSTSLRVQGKFAPGTWAQQRTPENQQRIIVAMAGGATYSESRVCYEVGRASRCDVVLATSHMLTPQLYIRQVSDLSRDKRQLDLPMDRPKPRVPPFLLERPRSAQPPSSHGQLQQRGGRAPPPQGGLPTRPGHGNHPPVPPTQAMSNMRLNHPPVPPPGSGAGLPQAPPSLPPPGDGKLHKEKKRHKFLGLKK